MNTTELAAFARYYYPDEAEPLLELLKQHNVPYCVEHERNQIDSIMIGGGFEQLYVIKIPAKEFERVSKLQQETIKELPELSNEVVTEVATTPERLSVTLVIASYILSWFAMMGIFVGLVILKSTRRLPTGEKIFMYDERSRMHGRVILFIAIARTTLWILPRLGWMQLLRGE